MPAGDAQVVGPSRGQRARVVALGLVPGALVVTFSFQSGGYFPGATAIVAIGFVLALALRITAARQPAAGLSPGLAAGAALLILFAVWTLVSSLWSHAPARALIEYDRALLYLLVFVTFGAFGRTPQRLRWLLRGLALGIVAVCVCSLVTRLAPDVWQVTSPKSADRLSYPLSYWNSLGLLGAFGCIFCLGLTTDGREPPLSRVAAAAALPLLSVTVVLTLSRGSIAAGALGIVAVVVIARPGLLLSGLVAAGPTAAIAVRAALDADLATNPAGVLATAASGHRTAVTLALCTGAAALIRALALKVDPFFGRLRTPGRLRRRVVLIPAAAALAAAGVAVFVALNGAGTVSRQVDRFTAGDTITQQGQSRLTSVGNNGRLDQWRVALDTLAEEPVRGAGAGTFSLQWEQRRPVAFQVEDGHSLYFEVLSELGIVGLVLVGSAVLLILGGLAVRARGAERGPAGVLCAAALAWAVHAGVDWDWEMPAVTLWVFAAGGTALAAAVAPTASVAGGSSTRSLPHGTGRLLATLACLFLALAPLSLARSERPLRDAQRAFARGDCPTAIDRALTSSAALGSRPEPYLILGYCDVRAGYPALARSAVTKAVVRDPRNWEYRYGLALVLGAQRLDPRPAARRARDLNPRSALAAGAVKRFATRRPGTWRRRALAARLPFD